jgi:plasmid maintenance system antidote protein VapI|tara:strand:- start:299 stop:493 length:195 start_codon:yes stop_codon:yes gene_type:complete
LNELQVIKQKLRDEERSQRWLARKLNKSHSLINMMLKGERTMDSQTKIDIANILGEEPESLYNV